MYAAVFMLLYKIYALLKKGHMLLPLLDSFSK